MTKGGVPDAVVAASACASIAEAARKGQETWTELRTSIRNCFVKTADSKGYVLDPFSFSQTVAEIRSRPDLAGRVGEVALVDAETWARQEIQAATLAFDGELRKLCAQEIISVVGRFPAYVLEGYLTVRLSSSDRMCTVGDRKMKTLMVNTIWDEIASVIKQERLRGGALDDFLVSFQMAYRRAISLRNVKMGASIPIKDIFRELVMTRQSDKFWRTPNRQHFSEYTEEFFRRDLANLIAAGRFATRDGGKIELMPTAFAKDGVAVIVGEGVRFFGHVIIEDSSR